jgi:hypothetical protein
VTFAFRPAKRESVSLLIGLAGGTGSGKTYSAMQVATGLAGDAPFAVIDTEAGRAKHYADDFRFDHGGLTAPFTPAAYADAIEAADKGGYPVIVVDSASHEHAGDGGLLDMHDAEFERLGSRDAVKMSAWIKPKSEHKRMVQRLLQVRAHVILCFRAEEKIEIVKDAEGKTVVRPKASLTGLDGWIPVCEKTLPYELTLSFLLTADAPGMPKPIKLQEQHRALVPLDKPLSRETGTLLGEWARGGEVSEGGGAEPSQATSRAVTPANALTAAAPSEVPEALALTTELLALAERVEADLELVAASIAKNATEHDDEPAKHVAWLKRQRTTLRKRLDEHDSPFKPPEGALV